MLFCQNIELNNSAETIINNAVDFLLKNIELKPLGIILTGSFSRGEGSIYKIDNKIVVLGDIEMLIYYKQNIPTLEQTLADLSIDYTNYLKNNNIECKIEFGLFLDSFFSRSKTTIFAVELSEEGKVLWGDKDLLKKRFNRKKEKIEVIDGLYLLCNRIIEQLKSLDYILKEGSFLDKVAYSNIKIILDIPTAILTINNSFITGYLNRANKLIDEYSSIGSQIFDNEVDWNNLIEDIKFWTEYKIKPCALKDIYLKKFPDWSNMSFKDQVFMYWIDLVPKVKKIWEWQVKSILSKGEANFIDPNIIFKLQTRSQIVKDWIKLLLRYYRTFNEINLNYSYFLKSSPRHLIYTSASELYFNYPDLLSKSSNFSLDSLIKINNLLPIKFKNSIIKKLDISSLINNVYKNWVYYIR